MTDSRDTQPFTQRGHDFGWNDSRVTTQSNSQDTTAADALRDAMVERIRDRQQRFGTPLPPPVEDALRRVPRHLFTPGTELENAYSDTSVITKTDERGVDISAVSAPQTIAAMLSQLDARPGQRVLEIGSGGYNAALLAELVGPDGGVTTVDIDADVVDRARACLDDAGYGRVRTVLADGDGGAAEYGPFDRIIVTVGAEDIPPAWWDQLTPNGRMVVPLRTRALMRSWALDRDGERLVSRSHLTVGFVPMQGIGRPRRSRIDLHKSAVTLWADERPGDIDTSTLDAALTTPRVPVWSGVTRRRGEPMGDQDLWLATTDPDAVVLIATATAVEEGLVAPTWRMGTPALIQGSTLAYRAKLRPVEGQEDVFEFGAYAHGPDAQRLADYLAERIRVWDRQVRDRALPQLTVHPAGTPDTDLSPESLVLDKPHTRVEISWTPTPTPIPTR